jgi:hypothetical protein
MLEREGADAELVRVLRGAIGQREGVDLIWQGRPPAEALTA